MIASTKTQVESLSYVNNEDAEPVTTGADNGLTLDDVTGLDYDDPLWDDLLDQMTLEELETIALGDMYKIAGAESIGVAESAMAEGPQGVSSWITGTSGANYQVQMYLALTWNKEIAHEQGTMFGREARALAITSLCAPAVNIHRTPYSGRNFEYFSEDGYLAGMIAANEVYGAREEGIIMIVKHFALNDQESNRGEYYTSLFTWSKEQAIREVYVKPFELAVKVGKTTGIMTSFNRIGSTWTGASKALCTDLLRTEWGFRGLTLTDLYCSPNNEWWMNPAQGFHAGQSTYLSFNLDLGFLAITSDLSIDTSDASNQVAIRECAHQVLYTLSQCTISPADYDTTWFTIAVIVDVIAGLAILAYAGFIVWKAVKKDKKKE